MVDRQPVSRVEWRERATLTANTYNPNHVAPPELRLLKLSLLADGWTQPIVARADGEIVDGYHRWLVSADPAIAALTGGLVPVVVLGERSPAQQMLSTIRHNRARGTHGVAPMAAIVRQLIEHHGMSAGDIEAALEMEDEEVDRLYDRGGMVKRGAAATFGTGWVPR